VPPALSSSMSWPRVAWICWTRRSVDRMAWPSSGESGTRGWPVLQCTRCLRPLPSSDGVKTVWSHLRTFRFWPTTQEVRRTRIVLGPYALPPLRMRPAAPDTEPASPPAVAGRGSLDTSGDVKPTPGPAHTEGAGPRDSYCPWTSSWRPRVFVNTLLCYPTRPERPFGGSHGAASRGGPRTRPRRS